MGGPGHYAELQAVRGRERVALVKGSRYLAAKLGDWRRTVALHTAVLRQTAPQTRGWRKTTNYLRTSSTVCIQSVCVGPCHHVMARPQVADGGTASDMEGSCE